jgi:hypothetical protein
MLSVVVPNEQLTVIMQTYLSIVRVKHSSLFCPHNCDDKEKIDIIDTRGRSEVHAERASVEEQVCRNHGLLIDYLDTELAPPSSLYS